MQKGHDNSRTKIQAIFPSEQNKTLIILRGLPGSGKTTLASQLSASGGLVISTDDFFSKENRKYCFNRMELNEAHQWNQNRAKTFMQAGFTPLIVDNTNIESWEMRPYILTGLKCGYEVDIKEPDTPWKWNLKELERRNTHGVPLEAIRRMSERYEKNVTVEKIAKTASEPIVVAKSNSGEDSENTEKRKTATKQKCTSNENKVKNETKKSPQADAQLGHGKVKLKRSPGETRQPGTTKKGISLSANFSARGNSKRSFGDNNSAKKGRKVQEKVAKKGSFRKGFDGTGNAVDVSGNSELNLNDAVTNKNEQTTDTVSSADVTSTNEQKTLEKQTIYHVDMGTVNELNASIRSECANETFPSEKSPEMDSRGLRKVGVGIVPGDEARLHEVVVFDKDDGSKSESSIEIVPSCQKSPLVDKEIISKNISDKASFTVEKVSNEEIGNESDTHDTFLSQQTILNSERDFQFLSDDDGDYESNQTRCNSEAERCGSSNNKTKDAVPLNSDKETFTSLITVQNETEQVENNKNSSPQYSPQNETLDVKDLARAKDACIDVQCNVPDVNNEETNVCFNLEGLHSKDLGLESITSLPCIELQSFKDEHLLINSAKRNSTADAVIDSNISHCVLDTTSSFNGNRCGDSIFNCPGSKDNGHTNALSSAINMSTETIKNPVCNLQEHNRCDTVDPSIKADVPHTGIQAPSIDLFQNQNSNARSDAKLDVSNVEGASVCKGRGEDHATNGTSINPNMVKSDPIITLSNPGGNSSNDTVDLCAFPSSPCDDAERDYENVSKSCSKAETNSVNAQFHSSEVRKPLIDRTKANDGIFDSQTCDSCTNSDKPGSAVDGNDSPDSIQFLKDCFPLTQVDILNSFLNSCKGDLIKTVDLLLDYNKSHYQSLTSVDYDMYQEQVRSPVPSTKYSSPNFTTPTSHNREQDVPSNYFKTPEENRSSYGSPMSGYSTPTKIVSVDSLQLTLDPALALQLLEMFGAFSGVSAKDPLSESARTIRIDKDLAKLLYTKWRKSIQAKNKEKKTGESKKFPPGLSQGNARKRYKTPPRQFYLPDPVEVEPPKSATPQPEPVSLKEIMDEQLAIHFSESDQVIEKKFLEEQLDLSTKLKRSRLHGMFPSVDPVALNEIFQANNYDFDTTVLLVQSSCGMPPIGTSSTVTEQSFALQQSPSNRQSDFQSDISTDITDVDGNFQSMHDPCYQDYRAEAQTHFELRAECIKKAAIAYNKRQGELAKIYADQARQHGEKIKEANRRAAEKILESRNHDLVHSNTLDLHELHVKEAIQALDSVLEQRRNERRSRHKNSLSYIEVITGRGIHSRYGIPRIKVAVMEYLKRHGYRYEELNSGSYRVFVN